MTGTESMDRIEALLQLFPNAPYLLVCKGQNLHLLKDLEASEEAYEAARAIDPHRLEGMADYSNSLFVQSKEEKLAHLTHSLAEAGREDAEVCCAVGNYHTLRGDNHRAVEVFKRAVRLDPSCSSAWILLGHAYIELKDSIAASEMYRKALELNPRDVRAWTGLGNTYELNSAWAYALHYHKKAAANSPYDFRFWASMANCYEKLRLNANAIECYKKILTLEDGIDSQLVVMESIARLYEDGEFGNVTKACLWHCRIVELIEKSRTQEDTEGQEGEAIQIRDHVHSYLIAARWEMGDFAIDGAAGITGQDDFDMQQADDTSTSGDVQQDEEAMAPTGNLTLANEYLQRAIMTGTEAALEADELLKRLAFLRT
jgi:anaphase-promoting complex subunit 8